jgi:hypothetical protein
MVLTWREEGAKGVDAKHAEVADSKGAAVELVGGELWAGVG